MVQLAICDDNEKERTAVRSFLDEFLLEREKIQPEKIQLNIEEFDSALALDNEIQGGNAPDILLLDICMAGMNGVRLAQKIREKGLGTKIVFLTSSRDYAVEAFSLDACHYLVKPFSKEDFAVALDRALESFKNGPKKITLTGEGGQNHIVDIDEIVYIESIRYKRYVHAKSGVLTEARLTLTKLLELLESLSPGQFISPYRGYIVNLDEIRTITSRDIEMQNGDRILIKPGDFAKIKKIYFDYSFERGGYKPMSTLGIATLVVNFTTTICYASGLFVLSDKKDGALASVLRLAVFFLFIMGLCVFAVLHHRRDFYWFINYIEIFAMLAVFSLDSSGCFAKKLFLVTAFANWFFVTMIPCEATLQYLPYPFCYYFYAPIRLALYAALIVFWLKRGRAKFEKATEQITPKRWALLCVFSVTSILCMYLTFTRLLMLNTKDTIWDYAISAGIMLTVISAYVIIIKMIEFLNEENEMRIIRGREKVLREELEAEQKFIELSRQNRHDIRHHNRLMIEFLNKGDTEGLRKYLAEYDSSIENNSTDFFCENIVANAMIRRAKDAAEQYGIGFFCEAEIPARLPLSDTETCVLLGNILENAIEACKKCKDAGGMGSGLNAKSVGGTAGITGSTAGIGSGGKPGISISAKIRHKKLYLSVRNDVLGTVELKDGLPKSSKQNGGVGIRSILTTLQSHGGMLSFAQGAEFVTQVILPV